MKVTVVVLAGGRFVWQKFAGVGQGVQTPKVMHFKSHPVYCGGTVV